jgi:hypothetical protein
MIDEEVTQHDRRTQNELYQGHQKVRYLEGQTFRANNTAGGVIRIHSELGYILEGYRADWSGFQEEIITGYHREITKDGSTIISLWKDRNLLARLQFDQDFIEYGERVDDPEEQYFKDFMPADFKRHQMKDNNE